MFARAIEFDRYKKIEVELEKLRKVIVGDEYSQKIQTRLTDLMQETFPELQVSLFGNEKDNLGKKLPAFISTDINFSENGSFSVGMDNHGHGIRRQFLFNAIRGLNDVFNEINKAKSKRDDDIIEQLMGNKEGNTKSKMLLIEEPELFLHPQSVRMFADVLYELADQSEFQIISATHSLIMIDLARDHTTLIRVENKAGESIIHQVTSNIFEDDEKETLKMLNAFNPYVCEAFFADKVILVEGDTEAIVYREVLSNMVKKKVLELNSVPLIVNCGSKMNIPSFQKVLRHFDIEYFVIHDLDNTYNKDGKTNAAWTMNEKIYAEIVKNNENCSTNANRFIMERNFEDQHDYTYNSSLGKPLSAFKLAAEWDIEDASIAAINAIRMCLGLTKQEYFDQNWVNERRTEKIAGPAL